MKVFVFGATGFLGRVLVHRLVRDNFSVSVLTRDRKRAEDLFGAVVTVHLGDMIDKVYPLLSDYDVIINCAGEIINKALMRRLHVGAVSDALLSLTEEGKTQWIQLSSVGVYGDQNAGVVGEDHSFNPVGEYEVTKAEGEMIVDKICRAKSVPYTIIRPSNVFGDTMPNQSLAQLIKMIKRKIFFFIGDPGFYKMNYVHVDDVVAAIVTCIGNSNALNNDFIISDFIDQRSFVKLVKSEIGGGWTPVVPKYAIRIISTLLRVFPRFPLTQGRLNALTNSAVYSTVKIKNCLGFVPNVGIQEGLRLYCKNVK